MKVGRFGKMWMVGLLFVVGMVSPASAAGRQILNDGNDSDSSLDLSRIVFRYSNGNVIGKMTTHQAWRIRDIASVARAGDRNFYMNFDTSGDYRDDFYVGVYRDNRHLVGIIRENDGARIGDRVARIGVRKDGRRIEFKFAGSLINVGDSRIHWYARTLDTQSCQRLCYDQAPNSRWAVYRF